MPGFFDQSVVNQVQQANDIIDVVGEHLSLKKKGREMVGLCPFHDDHRPSLYVNPGKQIFKCFACGAGGDVFKFVQMRENLSFSQAIERLAERVGIKLKVAKTPKTKDQATDVDPSKLAKVNAWAAAYFERNLADKEKGKRARDYLAERQMSPESIKKWRLGLAVSNDDLFKAAKGKGIPSKLLEQAGLIVPQMGGAGFADKFVNRLMFPITDVTGRVIGFGGRTLDQAGAKYINSPTTALFDKSNCLYGLEHARHHIGSTGLAVVVEGYTDCIMAHSKGCGNVVATLGTSFTSGHGRLLRRYAKKVVLVFDSDTAGIEAANRALEVCLSQHIDISLASVPAGKDPCDFILSDGEERFKELVDEAVDVFRFKWNRLTEAFQNDDTLVDNKAAVEEFLQTIATAVHAGNLSAIDRGLIVNRLSKIIGLDGKEINSQLRKRLKTAERIASYNLENRKVRTADLGQGFFAAAQREILEVLLNEPGLFETVQRNISRDVFDVPIYKEIAEILFDLLSEKPAATLAEVLARAESTEAGSVIVQLAQTGEEKGNFELRLSGALEAVKSAEEQKKKSRVKPTEDQINFLRSFSESATRRDPRNVGMVE
ncbi:MAG: DNA primase [Planctomycetota bacterium]|nr:MAG: DNA primase [Planctomycetota bacterium]